MISQMIPIRWAGMPFGITWEVGGQCLLVAGSDLDSIDGGLGDCADIRLHRDQQD